MTWNKKESIFVLLEVPLKVSKSQSEKDKSTKINPVKIAEEESSEVCAEDYLSGKLTTDQFLSEYVKLRSRHHQTKAKMEDVAQTNRQLQQFGGGGSSQPHWKS